MSIPVILSALHDCENGQNNNLIGVMAILRSSRASQKDAHVASMVRGLCTQNTRLTSMLLACQNDVAADPDMAVEIFKLFANDFILWFDTSIVIFEKYLSCFPIEGDSAVLEKPLLHCGCYPAFVDSALTLIRNPFVVERLNECKSRSHAVLEKYSAYTDEFKLNDICFDRIRDVAGTNVSGFFTLDQIVDRTRNEPLYMGSLKIEFLLLNLRLSSQNTTSKTLFNALAMVSVPENGGSRSVLYPPFRVNELSVSYTDNQLSLTTLALFDAKAETLVVTGPMALILSWYGKLARIFPTTTRLVTSEDLKLSGLGINTVSDASECDSVRSEVSLDTGSIKDGIGRTSDESCRGSFEIMKKTLSSNGIATDQIKTSQKVVEEAVIRNSVRADYDYTNDAESVVDTESFDGDLTTGFDFVTSKKASQSNGVSASLPDLSQTLQGNSKHVYKNAAGSAIDIHNFGKNYNPSFCSTEDLAQITAKNARAIKSKEETPQAKSRSSIFGFFKKNKSKENLSKKTPVAELSSNGSQNSGNDATSKEASLKSNKLAPRPELTIEVPKIGSVDTSEPLSATSSNFSRPLPLPFALPSSTSTYFFRPPAPGGLVSSNNNSTTSLLTPDNEESLIIPDDLKDIVNSEDTIDFYISPTSPKSMRVSRWKQKYGKWELLTTNENLFIKIVTNHELHKSWILVFKEEYDESYNEVIDKPVLMMNIDTLAKVRQSSALDLEINSVNSVTNERMLVIVRCYNNPLLCALKSNIESILEVMNSKPSLVKSSTFNSSHTVVSSVMSTKPSASSTLTSLHTTLNEMKPTLTSTSGLGQSDETTQDGDLMLLDRNTIRLHKQQESYEMIHKISSWKTITMYSLSVYHSCDTFDKGWYHFHMEAQDEAVDDEMRILKWKFPEDSMFSSIERIGKAALLVKLSEEDMYMLECKGKKEFKRLVGLF